MLTLAWLAATALALTGGARIALHIYSLERKTRLDNTRHNNWKQEEWWNR